MAYIFMTDGENYVDGTCEPDAGENAVIIQPKGDKVATKSLATGPSLYQMKEQEGSELLRPVSCEFSVELKLGDDPERGYEDDMDGAAYAEVKIGGTPILVRQHLVEQAVEDRVAVAEAAGLRPLVMDVESYAAQAAFEFVERQLPQGAKNKIVVLVDVGASAMNVTVFRNDQQVYAREQAFGGYVLTHEIVRQYGMNAEDAEIAKRSNSLPDNYESEILRPFMDNLALEVSRVLQFFFTSTQYNQVDHIVLAGGCAVSPGIDQVVAGRTQIDTFVANPFHQEPQVDLTCRGKCGGSDCSRHRADERA